MKGKLFIISSPSGGGKGTLIKELLKSSSKVGYSVSYTTREKRVGEEHGKDYFFVGVDEFKELIDRDKFIEFAEVHGNFYGTSKSQVEKETSLGNDIILEIDVQGAKIVQEKFKEAIGVFILPPSYDVLKTRLTERNTESPEALRIRLSNAKQEVKACEAFDYIVVNDEVERAAMDLETIFLAERLRRDRQQGMIRDILTSFDSSDND